MCLIVFHWQPSRPMPLIVAANRDEYHHRPSRQLQFWPQYPHLLAGQDLEQSGSWLGLSRSGRFAALTNYREAGPSTSNDQYSRGHLVRDYLTSHLPAQQWVAQYGQPWGNFAGFNLLLIDASGAFYLSNRARQPLRALSAGFYGLSNHQLDTPWPKVERCKQQVIAASRHSLNPDILFSLLQDRAQPQDSVLPDTGVGLANERRLAPIFIQGAEYGTRCSSVLLVRANGKTEFSEQGYDSSGEPQGRSDYCIRLPTDSGLCAAQSFL